MRRSAASAAGSHCRALDQGGTVLRIAVAFFGLVRRIDHTLDGDVLWTVVRVTARQAGVMGLAAGESVCYIGCHLLESSGGDWGYKSLDESVHPYYYSCPLRYLDMAPVQSSEWRERVHRFHAGRAV